MFYIRYVSKFFYEFANRSKYCFNLYYFATNNKSGEKSFNIN